MAKIVSRAVALRSPGTHSFRPKVGYIDHGRAPLADPGPHPADRCSPPTGAADQSRHSLIPPGGAQAIVCKWHAAGRTWAPEHLRGHRLGFADVYLSRAGWTYGGAVNAPAPAPAD